MEKALFVEGSHTIYRIFSIFELREAPSFS